MGPITETVTLGDASITFEVGRLARQAHGAVAVYEGRAMVLATVVSAAPREGLDFFPLTVDYRERMAAAGRIPGSFGRREGRITDQETLASRLIDRSLRPLFPKGYRGDTQVIVTVYSAEKDSDLPALGLLAAAAALHVSDVPFSGPVATTRLSTLGQRIVPMARAKGRRSASLDLMLAVGRDGLIMLEAAAESVPEETILAAIDAGIAALEPVLDSMDRLREMAGKPKRAHKASTTASTPPTPELLAAVRTALAIPDRGARDAALSAARAAADAGIEATIARTIRAETVAGRRIGGRGFDEVRPIDCEVGLLKGTHGSAVFTRGETQALVTTTLGTADEGLTSETIFGRVQQPFILHYNFPPFSVGDVRPMRGPGRREIGHGTLAWRALMPVMPDKSAFPYTVRLTSDITESNGSSSMATVCGGSLALMDAGVPLSAPVAGIAMGLVFEDDRVAILSDILGDEDHHGDMDFKVAGTADGVTALQLDNKLGAIPRGVLAQALEQARVGRLAILEEMAAVLAEPRPQVKEGAPQFARISIPKSLVGAVIGAGGKTVQELQSRTGTRIDVTKDGSVKIYGRSADGVRDAREHIEGLSLVLKHHGLYVAQVVALKEYGLFVRIGPHEGLVHVSELGAGGGEEGSAPYGVGDELLIRVIGVDNRGRVRLSGKAAEGAARADALNA